MIDTGLDERALTLIRGVLGKVPGLREAVLFGSRAKGNYRPESDIDLALVGVDDPLAAATVAGELDELPLPYKFDVQSLACIDHVPLREHIARVGVRIYPPNAPA